MEKNKIKISIALNVIIFIFTTIASIIMFTGFKFMNGNETALESTRIGMLRFFTVDSNMLMGIVALLFSIDEIKLINNIIEDISTKKYIIKLMATTGVALTFFVVISYLGPISKYGTLSFFMNSNLFFHLLIPVISMINFAFFERTNKIKFKYTIFSIIPMVIYSLYYLINIIIHMENGKVSPLYDWYWFVQTGVWTAVFVIPIIYGITYLIGIILWRINKK